MFILRNNKIYSQLTGKRVKNVGNPATDSTTLIVELEDETANY